MGRTTTGAGVRIDGGHVRASAAAGLNGAVAMAVLGLAAMATDSPLVVPPIGASVFLVVTMPGVVAASPRSVVGGHAVGLVAGFVALVAFGLRDHPTALVEGMTGARVGATALALALTCAGMVLLRVPHPPAGATTLVVSLGLVRDPLDLLVVLAAVAVVALQGVAVARLQGPPPRAAGIEPPLRGTVLPAAAGDGADELTVELEAELAADLEAELAADLAADLAVDVVGDPGDGRLDPEGTAG